MTPGTKPPRLIELHVGPLPVGRLGAMLYVVVDTRERAVRPYLDSLGESLGVPVITGQIVVGDFAVCRAGGGDEPPRILATIERKSYEDHAASFKDGRISNVNKMSALRDEHPGCQLWWLSEGPRDPSPGTTFGRVRWEHIDANLRSLAAQFGVLVRHTRAPAESAREVIEILQCYERYDPPVIVGGAPRAGGAEDTGGAGGAGAACDAAVPIPEALLRRVAVPDIETAGKMWGRLAGIQATTGAHIARALSLADLLSGRASDAALAALRTDTGRKLSPKALASLRRVRSGDKELVAKMISSLPNVGAKPAAAALTLGVRSLVMSSVEVLQMRTFSNRGRDTQIGPTRARRIHKFIHFREGDRAPEEPPEAPAKRAPRVVPKVASRVPPKSAPRSAATTAPAAGRRLGSGGPRTRPPAVAAPAAADPVISEDEADKICQWMLLASGEHPDAP